MLIHKERPGVVSGGLRSGGWLLTRQRDTATGAGATLTDSMAPPTSVSSPAHRSATEYSPATLSRCGKLREGGCHVSVEAT